jgi:hypothetical protein
MSSTSNRIRAGATALALAGLLFVAYPALRPWNDETTVGGATASMSAGAWVASHFFAMIGFILVPLGLLAVRSVVASTRAERPAAVAFVLGWLGAGLVLPYYGAEDFGVHGIAGPHGRGADLLAVVQAVRYQPVAVTIFGTGLILLAVASILAAVAVWRSGVLPRASAVLFAVGFALYLPQFFGPPALRVGHGVLVGAGSLLLAGALWRAVERHGTAWNASHTEVEENAEIH